jgi:hypothetical protein
VGFEDAGAAGDGEGFGEPDKAGVSNNHLKVGHAWRRSRLRDKISLF